MLACTQLFIFFFFNDTATTEIYTLSLHDALPISLSRTARDRLPHRSEFGRKDEAPDARVPSSHETKQGEPGRDRKSTRLNSSHLVISYAVFCLKKKKKQTCHQSITQLQQSHSGST